MKILIPPSEGKAKVRSQEILFKDTKFKFAKYTQQIVDLLCLIENEDLTSVYGTTQDKAIMFHRQNQDVFNSKCVPAIERYTGVVYNHIDWASLSSKAKNYMEKHIIIFSGLFGLLPQVHRKAYTPNKNTVQVDFLVQSKGKTSAAGHFGKAVKGQFIRFLATNQVTNVKDFSKFEYDGFKWNGKQFIKKTD